MTAEPMVKMELLGLPQMVGLIARQGAGVAPTFGAAILEEAHIAFRESQVLVPVRTGAKTPGGTLKTSGRVDGPMVMGTEIVVDISYGGAASAYAYIMHRGTMHGRPINYTKPGAMDHYLSRPVEALLPGMDNRLALRIQAMIDGA
jgi:hypothetical protein